MQTQSNEEHHESIPLDVDIAFRRKDDRKGYFFSRRKLVIGAVVVVLWLIVVIALAVLVGIFATKEKKDEPTQSENITISATEVPTTVQYLEPTTAGTEQWWNPRLPKNVIPKHYDLYLNISLVLDHYEGGVEIEVEVKEDTDLVILHAERMFVQQLQIRRKSTKDTVPKKNHFMFDKYKYFVIEMEESLTPGLYIIQMSFFVHFSGDSRGLYKDSTIDKSGKKQNFTATQFEDRHARKAFPCFDEPAMKATFNITIAHHPAYVALTNMPVYKTEMVRGLQIDSFMRTNVVMPTYLLAFVVGDFVGIQEKTKNNITMRYYSQPPYTGDLNYAKSIGGRMLTNLEQLLDIKYPLPKEDMIAIPDFPFGGMENWGLILYSDRILLWNQEYSDESRKLLAASVISHELAHMWFGNLVTLNWWNDIWLNEGLAKYFAFVAIPQVEPDWKNQDRAILQALPKAMAVDVQTFSTPISMKADKIEGTDDLTSTIYYEKGMYILRMVASVIGENTFFKGLKIYLKRHAYSSVVTDDLWRALREASCLKGQCVNVKQIMDPWTLQVGFPVLSFRKINATHYAVSQSHFNVNNVTVPKSMFSYSWVIPLTYAIKDKGRKFTWMNMTSATIEWDGKGWIKANTDHNGYYVTDYDESNWLALAQQLKDNHTVFSASDRAGLLFDLYQTRANVSYSTVFTLMEYMTQETEYVPWKMLFDTTINTLFENLPKSSRAYKYFLKYLVFLGKSQYERLGFHDNGTAVDKVFRAHFLDLFCKANKKSCTEKAQQMFTAFMKDPTGYIVPPNIRDVVFYYGVALGGVEEWDFLYKQFLANQNRAFRESVLNSLAASRVPWIIERYLKYLVDGKQIPKSYTARAVINVIKTNPQIVWGFLRSYWNFYSAQGKHWEMRFWLRRVQRQLTSDYQLKEVEFFLQSMGITDDLFEIKKQIQWLKQNEKNIELTLEQLLIEHNVL